MNLLNIKLMKKSSWIAALLLWAAPSARAQSVNAGSAIDESTMFYLAFGLVVVVAILVLVVAIYVLQLLKLFVSQNQTEEQKEVEEQAPSMFSKLWMSWNDLKPMEKEEEILLDHNYDGIKELDNHLPPWWKGLFYATIIYAIGYILIFHVFKTSPLQEEKYELEIAAAEALKTSREADLVIDFDENSVTKTTNPEELADGQKFYDAQCAVCHKVDGGGLAGPNLTDPYWKHGGAMTDIYKVIKNGVANTAMISWESQLNPVRMRNVASYVMTLQGTNPPGALGPDGELYEEPAEEEMENEE